MNKISLRLQAVKKILSQEKISSQEELLQRLHDKGFNITQATISRDLKRLQAGKKSDPIKGSVFFINESKTLKPVPDPVNSQFLLSGIKAVLFANMFGLIKTLPGYASSIAVHIDSQNRFEIIGTIAGDDTILLIPGQDISHSEMKNALRIIFPGLNEKYFRKG
ncbi:MAG: hypothetical protein V2I46_02365 [Bacteroides sp.]|jgi:transcriptional regulator of arginine metabolism|nr:hypothetical protein [Bacteroides sp.]